MRHHLAADALVAVSLVTGSGVLASTAQPEQAAAPLAVAVVRADGLLIPFANWDGVGWGNAWPEPSGGVSAPIAFVDIPAAWWGSAGMSTTWYVTRGDGVRLTTVVTAPSWYPTQCQQGIALAPARRVPAPPATVQPYPKVGLATSTPLTVTPVTLVSQTAPIWHAAARALQVRVTVREDPLAKRLVINGWRHPVATTNRRRVPVTLEALHRAPLGRGRFLHHFEAIKRYAHLPPIRQAADDPGDNVADGCPVATTAEGWFVAGDADATVAIERLTVRLHACEPPDVESMLPLGQFRVEGSAVWAAQLSGRGRERFVLVRWDERAGQARDLVSTKGGRCARE